MRKIYSLPRESRPEEIKLSMSFFDTIYNTQNNPPKSASTIIVTPLKDTYNIIIETQMP